MNTAKPCATDSKEWILIDVFNLQKAIDAPRYEITEEDYESVDSIRDALLDLEP